MSHVAGHGQRRPAQAPRMDEQCSVAGKGRRRLARATRMDAKCSADEMAGEHGLAELLDGDGHALAEVAIEN
jgi:hypothetical protein